MLQRSDRKMDNEIDSSISVNKEVSSEAISTVAEDKQNRLAKEREEKCTVPGSSQEILPSQPEDNATAQESDQQMLTSEYDENYEVRDHGQEILKSEHENESTEPESGQEILISAPKVISAAPESNRTCLTIEHEDIARVPVRDQEILTSKHEKESTEPESGQKICKSESENKSNASESSEACLATVHEDNSTASESGQEMMKSEYEDDSKLLETVQESSISDREDNATVEERSKEILLSEHEGNASVPGNIEEITPSKYENKSIVAESGKEILTSEQTDRMSEQDCANFPTGKISERVVLQRFVVEVKRAWKVVNSMTRFKLGIIPPICLNQGQKVGHWIKLSREVIPFVYVTSTGDSITEIHEISFSSDSIKTRSSSAAILITEYLNSVINQFEPQKSDKPESVKEMLKDVYRVLQSLIKDVDSITFSSTTRDLQQTLSEIKDLAYKVDQLSIIDNTDLTTPTERMVTITESHLLCFIIGLGDEFTQKMIDIEDERVMHKSPYYIIENFIEDGIYEIVKESGNDFEGNMKSKLALLGFSQEKSQKIIEEFSSHSHRTHSKFYLVKQYLENLFSTHPLLTKMPFLDRYANQPLCKWFDDEIYQHVFDEENARRLHLQVMKVVPCCKSDLLSAVVNSKFKECGHTLLFHGAKEADYLESFLREGIKLSCSVNKQDFSCGSGFYLSDDFEAAKDWVEKRRHRPNAVIIYNRHHLR